jgi:serine/threonine-protein kinase
VTAVSINDLVDNLRRYQLLGPEELEQLTSNRLTRFLDPRVLVRDLVHLGRLTPFQANRLMQGRGKELVVGPYRLLEPLRPGDGDHRFKARDVRMGDVVVLKIIPPEHLAEPSAVARLYQQTAEVARLGHPHIARSCGGGLVDGVYFIAREFVDGTDLGTVVRNEGPLDIPEACELIRQAALALQHAHDQSVVHRHVQPANLIVFRPDPAGPPGVKVVDFDTGLPDRDPNSSPPGDTGRTNRGVLEFAAPEEMRDPRSTDARADVYGLGATLYFLLTGQPPSRSFDPLDQLRGHCPGDAVSVRTLRPEVPPRLEALLARMLAGKPARRPPTCAAVASLLEVVGQPPAATPLPFAVKAHPGHDLPIIALPSVMSNGEGEIRTPRVLPPCVSRVPSCTRRPPAWARPDRRELWVVLGGVGTFLALTAFIVWLAYPARRGRPPASTKAPPRLIANDKQPVPSARVVENSRPRPTRKTKISPRKQAVPKPSVEPIARPTTKPKPVPPPPVEKQPDPPSAPPDTRRPVPSAEARQKARRLVREVFRPEYADQTVAGKRALAVRLLQQALETRDDLDARYLLFREARRLAAGCGDLTTTLRAVDHLNREYRVNALDLKTNALEAVGRAARTPAANQELAENAQATVEEAVDADSYEVAQCLLSLGLLAARRSGNTALVRRFETREKEVREIEVGFRRVRPILATLWPRTVPPEGGAVHANNLAAGRFLCFLKGKWAEGLPLLAQGTDADLRALAALDLSEPAEAAIQVKLGDGWWDRAEAASGLARKHLRQRACRWYHQAANRLRGLTRTKVVRRIDLSGN